MASDLDKRVQQRAYEIWESEGRPEGRQQEHWQQARTELSEAQSEASADRIRAKKEKPAAKAKPSSSSQPKSEAATKPKPAKVPRSRKD